jgi:hypothetical protein
VEETSVHTEAWLVAPRFSGDRLQDLKELFSENAFVCSCLFLSLGVLLHFPYTFLINFPLKIFHFMIQNLEGTGEMVAAAISAG